MCVAQRSIGARDRCALAGTPRLLSVRIATMPPATCHERGMRGTHTSTHVLSADAPCWRFARQLMSARQERLARSSET